MACEDCIASGDDCGRTYVVLRTLVDPGEGDRGRNFDLSMELEDALRLGEPEDFKAMVDIAIQELTTLKLI
jgi:hypothetical protein